METKKIKEMAEKINTYLKRFEKDKILNKRENPMFFGSGAYYNRKKVEVTYISYQGSTKLTPIEAEVYLKWLEEGNIGTHRTCFMEVEVPKEENPIVKYLYYYKKNKIGTLEVIKETEKTYVISKKDYGKKYMERVLKKDMKRELISESKEDLKKLVSERLEYKLSKIKKEQEEAQKEFENLKNL